MKKQKLITGTDRVSWEQRVNEYLLDGWTVVPGSLQITIAALNDTRTASAYAIVLES